MKRNFDLIKKILLKFEELPLNHNENEIIVEGVSKDEVLSYTVYEYDRNTEELYS